VVEPVTDQRLDVADTGKGPSCDDHTMTQVHHVAKRWCREDQPLSGEKPGFPRFSLQAA
jgi:hypothetical protein